MTLYECKVNHFNIINLGKDAKDLQKKLADLNKLFYLCECYPEYNLFTLMEKTNTY